MARAGSPTITADVAVADVPEGTLAQVTGTYSDADGDVVTLSASEGDIEKTGSSSGNWRWTQPEPDGPRTSTVIVTATDGDEPSTFAEFELHVQNLAPSTFTTGPKFVPVQSKSPRLFRWSASDVPADTVTQVVSCGFGTTLALGQTIIECAFEEPGTSLVGVTASDEDGGFADGRISAIATSQVQSVADGHVVIDGAVDTENMGGALAMADLNSDGRADLAVGSVSNDLMPTQPGPGYVAIVLGGTDATSIDLGSVEASAGYRILGAAAGEQLGRSLAPAGDVNGDGRQDLIVGAPQASPAGRAYAGAAYIVYGTTATSDLDLSSLQTSRGVMISGSAAGDAAGMAVSGVGDVNGDGYADVAVGSPGADPQGRESAGAVHVVFGGPSLVGLDLQTLPSSAGRSILGTAGLALGGAISGGDINGDDIADVIIGSHHHSTKVWVIYGSPAPNAVDTASFQPGDGFAISGRGAGSNSRFGAALASGDVDGDGYDDVIVGAPGWNESTAATFATGAVFIVRGAETTTDIAGVGATGGPRIFRYRGERSQDAVGSALAVGDWNADGRSDVVIGAHESGNTDVVSGSAYLVTGTSTLEDLDFRDLADGWRRIDGDAGYAYAGRAVAVGDFSGDGIDDISIGASSYQLHERGRASVFVSLDDIPPVGSVVINGGAALTASPNVSLSIGATDASSVVTVSISSDGAAWSTMPYLDATAWSLTDPASGGSATNGQRTVYVRWTDTHGNTSPVSTDSITLDTVAPAGQITIGGGAAATKATAVTISTPATDSTSSVSQVELSNDGATWSPLPYAASVSWVLPAGNGTRKVWAKWRDAAGNWSAPATDTIVLDTVAPTAISPTKAFVPGSTLSAGKPAIRFSFSGSDATSGIDHYELALSTDGGAYATVSSSLTAPTLTRPLASGHTYRARVRAIDGAGNVGAWAYGASFKLTTHQESSRSMRWTGTWRTGTSASYWGGHDRYATAAGARGGLTFTGRSFAWIGSVGPSRGWARVYVNGALVKSINLHAATSAHRRILFATSWSTVASRTVSIRIGGTTGHPRGDIDAFIVGS